MSWCHVFAHVCTLCQFMGARVHARTHTRNHLHPWTDQTKPRLRLSCGMHWLCWALLLCFSRISSLLSWAVFNGLPCNLGETKLLISHGEYFDSGQEVGHKTSVHARSHHHYHYIVLWLLSLLLLIVKFIFYLPRQSRKHLLLGIYYRRKGPTGQRHTAFSLFLRPTLRVGRSFIALACSRKSNIRLSVWWEDHIWEGM